MLIDFRAPVEQFVSLLSYLHHFLKFFICVALFWFPNIFSSYFTKHIFSWVSPLMQQVA